MQSPQILEKIPNTAGFITTPELSRLKKENFETKSKQEVKILTGKSKVETALELYLIKNTDKK